METTAVLASFRWIVILHAALGEIGILSFLWVLMELISKQEKNYIRAKRISLGGVILLFINWFIAGTNYIMHYKNLVEPAIKNTNILWVNNIIMEIKLHIFLFIPILALFLFLIILSFPRWSSDLKIPRKPVYALCILIVFLGFIMVSFGYIVSASVRANLGI
ncbi:MAG: hypothetical protein M1365_13855 [Actinobacteria bacterium]|nr:hypothetical protein [Actinomycetota bacterium]